MKDSSDNYSLTPLHFAVQEGNQEMLDLLLSFDKLDVNFPNAQGETPLMWAKTGKMVRFLIEKGASPHCKDIYGRNALFFIEGKDEDYLPALLEHNVDPNGISQSYGTCLFANFESPSNLLLLLPLVDKKTLTKLHVTEKYLQKGESILSKAIRLSIVEVAIEIIKAMARADAHFLEEDLHRASIRNHIDVVRHLLEFSEDIKEIVKNDSKFNLLCILNRDRPEILELLKSARGDSSE